MSRPLRIWTTRHLLVCVPADLPDDTTDALRELIARTPSVDAVLDLLASDGLGATPPFVCAADERDGTRVVIRGDHRAVAHGRDGSTLPLSSGRSATWNDDVIVDVARIEIGGGDGGGVVEWLAAGTPDPEAAASGASRPEAPAPPAEPPEPAVDRPRGGPQRGDAGDSHTLDEQAFGELRDAQAAALAEPEPALPPATPDPTPDPGPDPVPGDGFDFSQLLDDTRHRTAVPVPPAPPPPDAAPADAAPVEAGPAPEAGTGLGEHDGRTITLAELRKVQAAAAAPPPPPPPAAAASAPAREVRAVRCASGHPNPPTIGSCRRCGAEITDRTVTVVPRPVVARLAFESGLIIDVDRPQLIGRRPTAPADPDDLPNLVTIPSPDGDISRAHTAVRLEGWDLLVEDLGSTNGTEVRLPGGEPVRLREHDPVLAVIGTQVTLAGIVRFTIQAPES